MDLKETKQNILKIGFSSQKFFFLPAQKFMIKGLQHTMLLYQGKIKQPKSVRMRDEEAVCVSCVMQLKVTKMNVS